MFLFQSVVKSEEEIETTSHQCMVTTSHQGITVHTAAPTASAISQVTNNLQTEAPPISVQAEVVAKYCKYLKSTDNMQFSRSSVQLN